jgi:hypothetical protein
MPPLRKKMVRTRIHDARLTGESFLLDQSSSLILACPPRRAPGRAPGVPIDPQSGEGDLLCVYHADGRWKPSGWRHARLSSQCTHSCSLLFARRPLPMRCRAERGREGRSIFGLFPASVASRESRSSASNPRLFVHEGSAFETVLET